MSIDNTDNKSRAGGLKQTSESGAVAAHDVYLAGRLVAGRDVHFHSYRSPKWTGVFQLPPDIADFTGRDEDLRAALNFLERPRAGQGTAVIVLAIAGKAGVGKTALATRVAHLLRRSFPDAQLYVNLRGTEPERLDPSDVLDRFLRALGVAGEAVPASLEERRDLYRSRVADRRMLVVLDNAADVAQVEPLLPGNAGSAAIITSRMLLPTLPGVHSIQLDVLEPGQAIELLAKVAGQRRVATEPEAARRIIDLCGCLPLAVRIAGAKLQARAHWTLRRLADRLTDEHTRLAELRMGDLEVRASFDLTYKHLRDDERRAFRFLGLLKIPDFPAWVVAALLNIELPAADELAEQLVEAQVLEVAERAGSESIRYRFHDLLRLFAGERLADEESVTAQEKALQCGLDAHLALAQHAAELLEPLGARLSYPSGRLRPRFASVAERIVVEPAAWFATERVNLIAAVKDAHDNNLNEIAWQIARSLAYFFWLRNHWSDWECTYKLALHANRQAGNSGAEADALFGLGWACQEQERFDEAVQYFEQSLQLSQQLKDRSREGWALLKLGDLSTDEDRYDDAVTYLERCMPLFHESRDQRGEAWARFQLGVVDRFQSRYDEAACAFERVMPLFRETRDHSGEAMALLNLGMVEQVRRRIEQALKCFEAARPVFEKFGDRRGTAYTLGHIGASYYEQERTEEALIFLNQSLERFRELELRDGEAWVLLNLGDVQSSRGEFQEARTCFDRCLKLAREAKNAQMEARTFVALGDLYERQGRLGDARKAFDKATQVLSKKGDRLWEARALRGRGRVSAAEGQRAAAKKEMAGAIKLYREMGLPTQAEISPWLDEHEKDIP
jgi:tetratricopeptide (TPR) repeat protein